MATRIAYVKHQLSGDWTIAGIIKHVALLSKYLSELANDKGKRIQIDCKHIDAIDICGMELLNAWMKCARIRGVEAEMINLSDKINGAIKIVGFGR